eukprot:SAG11_NODE_9179_length_935_cov_0.861244_2_plen_120_part_00
MERLLKLSSPFRNFFAVTFNKKVWMGRVEFVGEANKCTLAEKTRMAKSACNDFCGVTKLRKQVSAIKDSMDIKKDQKRTKKTVDPEASTEEKDEQLAALKEQLKVSRYCCALACVVDAT